MPTIIPSTDTLIYTIMFTRKGITYFISDNPISTPTMYMSMDNSILTTVKPIMGPINTPSLVHIFDSSNIKRSLTSLLSYDYPP